MNKIEMKIRTKIDQIFSKYKPSENITELKEELIADLSEIANDQQDMGKSEDEAVEAAFKHLGDLNELMQEFDEVNKEDQKIESDENTVKIGKFIIKDNQIKYDDKVIIDEDRVDFGKFLKVEDGSVDMGNGFFRVDDDGISLGHERTNGGFSHLKLVNNVKFDISQINDLVISYSNDQLEIKQSPSDELIINEYMSRNNKRYYLRSTNVGNGQLYIKQGDRPIMWHVRTKIEIYLPEKYANRVTFVNKNGKVLLDQINSQADLSVTATNGATNISNANIKNLNLFCANGAIKLNSVKLQDSEIISNNGSITGNNLEGLFKVKTRNGAVKLDQINGGGDFNGNNGAIRLIFTKVSEDINAFTKNGAIKMEVPADTKANFVLQSKSGIVRNRIENKTYNYEAQGFMQGVLNGENNPEYSINAKSNHGSIKLI
ncbi:DUF4097 family beta strand repeat-containing protein [Companilactobacillus sp. DQM5]|uniref:DUF4097 family beta strand repeat-containing protein n=1 Tax=Companilactobacillus sp. DQM5 TaxID=3463359 RepID=UPI004058C719